MSSTVTPTFPTLAQIVQNIETLLKAQVSAALSVEAKTVLPPIVTFLNWLAVPGNAANGPALSAQWVLCQAAVVAAQATADSTDIASAAAAFSGLLSSFIAAA